MILLLLVAALLGWRMWVVLRGRGQRRTRAAHETCSVAAFLGSGGHTAELIAMLSALPPERYTPRTYLVSAGDTHSRGKAAALETRLGGSTPHVVTLPRARAVKQSFLSAPLSTAVALAGCMQVLVLPQLCAGRRRVGPDMLLMNGPGTCVPLVASVYVLRLLGLPSPQLVYIESWARVRSLSLTARLLRPFVDRFVVQWPDAAGPLRDGEECRGWLV